MDYYKQYLAFNEQYCLHNYKDKTQIRMGLYEAKVLNQLQADVVEMSTGERTLNEIWENIQLQYQVDNNEKYRMLFQHMVETLVENDIVQLNDRAKQITIRRFGKRMETYPFWLICELTNKCNFACPHCYKEASITGHYLDIEKVRLIVSEFAGYTPNLILTGGESLLHPQIEEVLQMTTENFETSLLTNGFLLKGIDIELLKKLKHIQISMYGYDEESYYRFTGNKKGFQALSEAFAKIKKCAGIETLLTLVLTPNNVNELEKYINAAIELGAPSMFFGLSLPLGRACKEPDMFTFTEEENLRIYQLIEQLRLQYKDKIHITPFQNQVKYIPLKKKGFACQAGKTNVVINEDGLVRGCNLLPSNEFSKYSLEQYIEDVHNGVEKNYEADLEKIRHHMEERGLTLEDMKCTGFCRIE